MTRLEALKIILESLKNKELAVFTTGMISREAFTLKDRKENFYMLGSMGLVTPVALGIAINQPKKKVVAIEGDGSMLLNLGSMAMAAAEKPSNFFHLVLDNESYESTGGQPSISKKVDLTRIAKAAGYKNIFKVRNKKELKSIVTKWISLEGPSFLLVKVESSHKDNLPRVDLSPELIKQRFMANG